MCAVCMVMGTSASLYFIAKQINNDLNWVRRQSAAERDRRREVVGRRMIFARTTYGLIETGHGRYGNVDRQKKNIYFCKMPHKQKFSFVKGGLATDMRRGREGS